MCACVSICVKRSLVCHLTFIGKVGRCYKSVGVLSQSLTYHYCTKKSCWVHLSQGLSGSRIMAERKRQVQIQATYFHRQMKGISGTNILWMIFLLKTCSPDCWNQRKKEENERKWSFGYLAHVSHCFVVSLDVFLNNDFTHYKAPQGYAVYSVPKIFMCPSAKRLLSTEHVNDHSRWTVMAQSDGDGRLSEVWFLLVS